MTAPDLSQERERQRRATVEAARGHAAVVEEYVTRLAESLRTGRLSARRSVADRSLVADGRVETRVATHPLVRRVEEAQYRAGAGPCIEAIGTAEPRLSASLAAERRWPEFASVAAEHGVGSTLGSRRWSTGPPSGP